MTRNKIMSTVTKCLRRFIYLACIFLLPGSLWAIESFVVNGEHTLSRKLHFESLIYPLEMVDIRAPYSGYVTPIDISFGHTVRAGTPLLNMQSPLLEDKLIAEFAKMDELIEKSKQLSHWAQNPEYIKAKLNLSQAKLHYKQAKVHCSHSVALFDKGIISQQNYLQDKNRVFQAKKNYLEQKQLFRKIAEKASPEQLKKLTNQIKTSEQHILQLQQLQKSLSIKSPMSGVLLPVKETIDSNEIVSGFKNYYEREELIARIAALSPFAVVLHLNEAEMMSIMSDTQVHVTLLSQPNVRLEGEILQINHHVTKPSKDNGHPKFEVVIAVSECEQRPDPLIFGMRAKVTIESSTQANGYIVPKQFIYFDQDRPYCLIAKPGSSEKKFIQVGDCNMQQVEVRNGLQEGDRLVTVG